MLVATDLEKRYRRNGERVLVDVSLSLVASEVRGLAGLNGAGKSTLLKILAGRLRATQGSVVVAGETLTTSRLGAARQVGLAEEVFSPPRGVSALQLVQAIAAHRGRSSGEAAARLEAAGLAAHMTKPAKRFSQGMRQRLGLALATIGNPPVLLLDEPTRGLDVQGLAWLRESVRGAAASGAAVLISSHELNTLDELCDSVVLLHRGSLVEADLAKAAIADAPMKRQIRLSQPMPAEILGAIAAAQAAEATVRDPYTLLVTLTDAQLAAFSIAICTAGVGIVDLRTVGSRLGHALAGYERAYLDSEQGDSR